MRRQDLQGDLPVVRGLGSVVNGSRCPGGDLSLNPVRAQRFAFLEARRQSFKGLAARTVVSEPGFQNGKAAVFGVPMAMRLVHENGPIKGPIKDGGAQLRAPSPAEGSVL